MGRFIAAIKAIKADVLGICQGMNVVSARIATRPTQGTTALLHLRSLLARLLGQEPSARWALACQCEWNTCASTVRRDVPVPAARIAARISARAGRVPGIRQADSKAPGRRISITDEHRGPRPEPAA
jgi:hypothetical protein